MIVYWTDKLYDLANNSCYYICKGVSSNFYGVVNIHDQLYIPSIQNCFRPDTPGIRGPVTNNLNEAKLWVETELQKSDL